MKVQIINKEPSLCWIYLDISQMALLEDLTELGITTDQRVFSNAQVLHREYPGSMTTLYYIRGSFRVYDMIPKSLGRVNQESTPVEIRLSEHEDRLSVESQNEMTLQAYLPVTPRAIITSIANSLDPRESVVVHLDIPTQRRLIQYIYHPEAMDLMMLRIQNLQKSNRQFLVTNQRLRDIWQLA